MLYLFQRMTQKLATVGLSATAFPTPATTDEVPNPEAIYVQSPSTNTGKIYVGAAPTANLSTPSFEILPGGDAMIPYVKDENLKHVSDVAAQKLMVTYLADRNF